MARLKVKHLGTKYAELNIKDGQEYSIGRHEKSDLVLDSSKGISRKHLRLFQDNGVWIIECLSRLGNMQTDGKTVTSLELSHLVEFSVGPFVFLFEDGIEIQKPQDEEQINHLASPKSERKKKSINPIVQKKMTIATSQPVAPDNQTQLLSSTLKAFIKVTGTETGKDSIFELEGNIWVAGRDPNCEIHIDDSLCSRKHFEVSRVGQDFFVTDLDSANGTELNGCELVPHKAMKILSGDTVSIQSIKVEFEVRDVDFDNRFELAKKQLATLPPNHPMGFPHYNQMMQLPPPDFSVNGVVEEKSNTKKFSFSIEELKNFNFKKHKIKIIIASLVVVMIIGLINEDPVEKKDNGKRVSASESQTFDSLNDEQKVAVKDMFTLTQQYYLNQKYELCLAELKKLHNIIPSYENSKKLSGLCEHGLILLRQEEDRLARERKREETEQKIITTVEYCQLNLKPTATVDEAQDCLQQATELDPQHPSIVSFLEGIQQRELEKQNQASEAAARRALQQKGRAHLAKAKKLAQQDELSKAVNEYKSFIQRNYPGLSKEETEAKRELASVKTKLDQKVTTLIEECESLRSNSKFKDAWLTCEKATKEDPSNKKAKDLKKETLSDLRREMKSVYQDSILEESLGNVDAAKEKWRLIRKSDLDFDDYYKKATRKLKKYGEGI